MRLDEHLSQVEKFGFNRFTFTFGWNEHRIHLLKNDARATPDGRLQVHLSLYCSRCDKGSIIRGKSSYGTEWEPRHMQLVKVAALAKYEREGCV